MPDSSDTFDEYVKYTGKKETLVCSVPSDVIHALKAVAARSKITSLPNKDYSVEDAIVSWAMYCGFTFMLDAAKKPNKRAKKLKRKRHGK